MFCFADFITLGKLEMGHEETRMNVAILGEALIDFKSTGALALQGFIGGSSLNVATATARLGQSTTFLTQISSDLFGLSLREHMTENGIDTSHVLGSSAQSTLDLLKKEMVRRISVS
jgi:fructokinase